MRIHFGLLFRSVEPNNYWSDGSIVLKYLLITQLAIRDHLASNIDDWKESDHENGVESCHVGQVSSEKEIPTQTAIAIVSLGEQYVNNHSDLDVLRETKWADLGYNGEFVPQNLINENCRVVSGLKICPTFQYTI